jgi:Spy/CpxP family protein refolding chaperone
MRTIKAGLIAVLALGGLLALTNFASAQDAKQNKKGRMTPEARLEQMTKDLDLTDAQKPKVKVVLEDTAKKRQELDPSERRGEKARALMEDETKQLKEILTPDQLTKWKKLQEERMTRGKKKADEKKDSQ